MARRSSWHGYVFFSVVWAVGCMGTSPSSSGDDGPDGDTDADTDVDVDSDVDSDTDADSDGDTDVDTDTDTDTGTDSSSGSDTDTAVESICDDVSAEPYVLFMSADDSNSQADPVQAREAIEAGRSVDDPQRIWEYLNYATFDYAPADPGTIRIVPQLRARDDAEGGYSLLVGVVSPQTHGLDRRPLNVVFSVDTSGSMAGDGIARAKESMRAVASELRVGDVVSLVSWSVEATIVLASHLVSGADDAELLAAIDGLETGGSTDLHNGLVTAYRLAMEDYLELGLNRVVLLSDGGANTGVTDEDLIAEHADEAEREGIFLVGVGTSTGGAYDDELMDTVTDEGKGAYVYVDGPGEAEKQFTGDRFLANFEVFARDVRLETTFPGGWAIDEFHGEEVSEDPEEVDPQHLGPNDAMLYHMDLLDCLAAEHDGTERFTFTVTWTDRARAAHETIVETSVDEMLGAAASELAKADAIVSFAETLPTARDRGDFDAVRAAIDEALVVSPKDADLIEIRSLIDRF